MKTLSPQFQAHLDSGATTLAWCWRVTRRDGVRLGFTDHDRALAFDGTSFEAATGFTASDIKDHLGLSVDNLEVSSALRADSLNEDDLAQGLFDDAGVEIWRVNWTDTSQRVLMRSGSIGEVKRSEFAFTAEVRGLAHYLQQPKGRLFQHRCDADLGDTRCRVVLAQAAYRGAGAIAAVTGARSFIATGLEAFVSGWFDGGQVAWSSGPNQGRTIEVKRHGLTSVGIAIELWQVPAQSLGVGHALAVTAGCDKQFATCKAKFINGGNFRGFPHLPGTDFVTSYPNSDDANNDGSSQWTS